MRRFPGLRRVFRLSGAPRAAERDVDEELAFHFAMREQDLVARGRTTEQARAEAEKRFGDVYRYRRELTAIERGRASDARRADRLDAFRQDLRHTLRGLATQPAFSLLVVATFALGIGANGTMFGVVDRLLLRPPPHVAAPDRVVELEYAYDFRGERIRNDSYPWISLAAVAEGAPALASVAAWAEREMTLGSGDDARAIRVVQSSGDYFEVLGVRALAGRLLTAEDDAEPAGQPVAVVSEGFWRRELGERLGATIELDRARYTVVGVVPSGFRGLDIRQVEAWVPIATVRATSPVDPEWRTSPGWQWLSLVGRLRDGATAADVAAQTTVPVERSLRRADEPPYRGFAVTPRSVLPLDSRRDSAESRVALLLAGVSLLVLLIASANVANLLLARALQRRREIAVRLALGAGRGRVASQLVLDGVVLALAGGAAALLVVHWATELVQRMLLGADAGLSAAVDARVLLFTVAATAASGIVAGIVPAVQGSRPSLTGALQLGPRAGAGMRARTRMLLVLTQAALSVVLLVGTGLFVRSLHNVGQARLGMDVNDVIVGTMRLRALGYDPSRIDALFRRMADDAAALPGVSHTATAVGLPLSTSHVVRFRIPERDSLSPAPGGGPYLNAVGPDFLPTLGIRLLRGRAFTAGDQAGAPRVTLVTARMASFYWPGQDPLGQCVRLVADTLPCTTVIGVVENLHRQRIAEEPSVQYLIPLEQAPAFMRDRVLFVRPAPHADRALVAAAVRRLMQGAAPDLPHAAVFDMSELLEREMRPWRLGALMFGAFGALALVLAAVGMYGVVSYSVAQRTHEMGVRMALGARGADVVRLVLRQGVSVVLAGVVIGLSLAAAAAPLVRELLFRTSSRDPVVYAGVALVLVAVACIAAMVPALRASRVDPATALRAE